MDFSRITKVILKNCQKNRKNDPVNRKKLKQAQRRAAAGRSRHKSQGEFGTRGRIFPHDGQNGFSLFSSF